MGCPSQGLRRMATAPSPTNRPRRQARPPRPLPRWRRWLLLGLLFGLGYGLTQRLLEVPWGEDSSKPPAFRAKPPSGGLSLEELRKQQAGKDQPLPADLEALGRRKREEQQKQEAARREEAERQKAALQEEKNRLENDRRRLESFDSKPDTPTLDPLREEGALPPTPTAPDLPPPDPFAMESPPPPSTPARPEGGAPSPP